jgi:biopolymer transport protein ExbD
MRRKRGSLRRRSLALTSLIDVIFILLLFFLLTSTFTRYGELVLAPGAAVAMAMEAAPPVVLWLGAEAATVNGTPHPVAGLPEALAPFRPDDGGAVPVFVTLGPEVTSQRLVELLALLRPLGWLSVTVLE